MFARLRRLVLVLALADLAATQLALVAADLMRRFIPIGDPTAGQVSFLNPVIHLIVAVVFPATFLALAVYDVRRDTSPVGEPATLTRAVVVATFVFAGVLYFRIARFRACWSSTSFLWSWPHSQRFDC
jgi:hypothetical protein